MTPEEAIEFLGSRGSYFSDASFFQAVNALRELVPKESPSDCIRVRIAVAVDGDGLVHAIGIDRTTPEFQAVSEACYGTRNVAQAVIEADIPKIPTVSGRVVEAKNGN